MASVYHLYEDALTINRELAAKYLEHGNVARIRHFAALILQRAWRGYLDRRMIKNWHRNATIIQKWIRGWLVRWNLPVIYKLYYDFIALKYYNERAAKIQAVWKGYKVRQTICIKDIMAKKKHQEDVNNNIRRLLQAEFAKLSEDSPEFQRQNLEKILPTLFNKHHLLRTKVKEGVLSIHGSEKLSDLEEMLRAIPLKDYMTKLKKIRTYNTC